jgi:AcrR family transcriptional regulator
MSPRKADPGIGPGLIEAAARLLAVEGPSALTTRRLATEVGASTTSVYSRFGGKEDLVRAVVHEGFAHLSRRMQAVAQSDDPVADVAGLGLAYRDNAREHSNLYAVMFGGAGLGGFTLTDDDRLHGRYTLEILVAAVERCIQAGRFRPDDPALVAHRMWIALHGLVTLELGGFFIEPYNADVCFTSQCLALFTGAGDTVAGAERSMQAAIAAASAPVTQPPASSAPLT